jgi:eukaryotic-like serine/threonine-protein kinase
MSQSDGLIGEKLGSFRIEAVLGSGAMGVVYRGTSEKSKKPAAIKVMSGDFGQKGTIGHRFERESEILQQLRHPNIVRFLAWGKFRGTSYIAMEYVQGETVEKMIAERGHLPWREVVELGIQICDALHYAHEHGVVHRDLKPSNLMVTADAKVKLADFGIAKDLDATALTATGRTLGTAAYMSPEQIRGTPAVSHKTDLYALGVVLYQMLVGKAPFEGTTPVVLMHCHLNEPPPRPSAKLAEIPRKLDDLVVSLMAKSPTDRPWDSAAVAVKLTELRDKADRGAPVAMVWPSSSAPPAANSSRGGAPAEAVSSSGAAPERTRKKKAKAGSTRSSRSQSDVDVGSSWISRSTVETGLLALALVAIAAVIGYIVWPPSAEYLFKHAEPLMASENRADWNRALEEYIDPLDTRYKDHPYHEQTRAWRDKILLHEAEGRAKFLTSGVKTSYSEPGDDAERKFLIANELAAKSSERKDDLTAVRQWQDLAQQVNPNVTTERKWHLLAQKRVEQLENAIKDRHLYIEKQWQIAEAALQAGRVEEAEAIRKNLVEQFSQYTDLAELFRATPAPPPTEPKNAVSPPAASAGPNAPEKHDSSSPSPPDPADTTTPRAPSPPPARPADPQNEEFSLGGTLTNSCAIISGNAPNHLSPNSVV